MWVSNAYEWNVFVSLRKLVFGCEILRSVIDETEEMTVRAMMVSLTRALLREVTAIFFRCEMMFACN